MEKPHTVKNVTISTPAGHIMGGRGCEYSEEGKDENTEIYRHRTEHRERPDM